MHFVFFGALMSVFPVCCNVTSSCVQVLSFLDALTYFLELNHYSGAAESVLHQRLKMLVSSRLPVEMEMCADAAQPLKGSSNCIKQKITGKVKQGLQGNDKVLAKSSKHCRK